MHDQANPFQPPTAVLFSETEVAYKIELVGGGRRFLTYLLDMLVVQVLKLVFAIVLVLILGQQHPLVTDKVFGVIYELAFWFLYYFLMEASFGRTVGKWATGTVVVNREGKLPTNSQAFKRSISRFVPFEPLSCFGSQSRGWHDSWSDTFVVRATKP